MSVTLGHYLAWLVQKCHAVCIVLSLVPAIIPVTFVLDLCWFSAYLITTCSWRRRIQGLVCVARVFIENKAPCESVAMEFKIELH